MNWYILTGAMWKRLEISLICLFDIQNLNFLFQSQGKADYKHFNKYKTMAKKHGQQDPKAAKQYAKVTEQFLELKLATKIVDQLLEELRAMIARIRKHERVIMDICVQKAHMPRKNFITTRAKFVKDLDI